jgi:putative endopeptidase
MRTAFWLVTCCLLAVSSVAPTSAASADKPGLAFSIDNIDKTVDPCTDFYQYACGNWLKRSAIPSDQTEWGSFSELDESNLTVLRGILEKAAMNDPTRDPIAQKIGDFYGACMDEKAVEAKGLDPLKPELERVAAVTDKDALIDVIAHDHLLGANTLFNFGSDADLHNADMDVAYLDQSGLTLFDRDYYIKDTPKMVEMRKHLVEYATQMFTLAGQTPEQAAASAQTVLRIETALAKASMDRTLRRDPKNMDHKMGKEQALALAPKFYLSRYLTAVASPGFSEMNVRNPEFFKDANALLESESLDQLKTYASWHVLTASAAWLSHPYVEARFHFRQYLTGQQEDQPRWKRCVELTDRELGEALGQKYVDLTFGADGKQRMLKMVEALEKSLGEDIQTLPWMSDTTKKQAEIKLAAITNKIGYPDKWRDYGSLTVVRGDLLGNYFRGNEFEARRELNKINQPVDRGEWEMTPPEVNAYYEPALNEIVFPAGILQPPFFDKSKDDAVNLGAIGIVIGHELTHGFDDEGRKYDPRGNLRDWWTKQDGEEFEKRASCVANEYGNFIAIDELKLNGKLTLGENTADNGGARIALMALNHMIADDKTGNAGEKIDGYTPQQRLFLGFGRVWCEMRTPEFERTLVTIDPHSPGKYRIDGVVQNMPEFQQTWGCKAGQPMVSANACRVW